VKMMNLRLGISACLARLASNLAALDGSLGCVPSFVFLGRAQPSPRHRFTTIASHGFGMFALPYLHVRGEAVSAPRRSSTFRCRSLFEFIQRLQLLATCAGFARIGSTHRGAHLQCASVGEVTRYRDQRSLSPLILEYR